MIIITAILGFIFGFFPGVAAGLYLSYRSLKNAGMFKEFMERK